MGTRVLKNKNSSFHDASELSDKKGGIKYLIRALIKYDASDLHLRRNRPPIYRIHGKLLPASMPSLNEEEVKNILFPIIPPAAWEDLETKKQIDFSFEITGYGRFRCNIFYFMGTLGASIRRIPFELLTLQELRVPATIHQLIHKPKGLLLITGGTGSGKSTTVAAIIEELNKNERIHIITIEDPIEFTYKDNKAIITQRELKTDFNQMSDALSAALRQDPDVLVIGEMRDFQTIQTAITAAETGHLVISTLHSNDAKSTIERILDVFPADQQNQVRVQLANSLIGIFSQQLISTSDQKSRVLVSEVLVKSPAIESCIRKNEIQEIQELISNSEHYYGMQTMNMDLEALVKQGKISKEEALINSPNPDDLKLRFSGIDRKEGYDISSEERSNLVKIQMPHSDPSTQED